MNIQLQKAQEALFGVTGLRASNFKLFPGNSREVSAEQVAREIHESIARIENGQAELVEAFAD